jgi:RHS repeat-associated protein
MGRLVLSLLMALSISRAGEVESSLAAIRQRLRSHSVGERRLGGLHRKVGLLGNTVAETSATLERLQGTAGRRDAASIFGYLRERLRTAARGADADFSSIEAKLAGLGLPEKLEAWREFVRHCRGRMAEVDAELAFLEASGSALSPGEMTARLEALKVKLGSTGQERIHDTLKGIEDAGEPPLELLSTAKEEDEPRLADDIPGSADLAETKVVQLTPEIRALAASLGGSAAALYTWVATRVEYDPYPGLMQNSHAVLLSGRGNDFDQATLLIALLRASAIPARYYVADIALTREQIRDWLGVPDAEAALTLQGLASSCQEVRGWIVTRHAWVEAYLDSGSGKKWMALDPSLKRRSYQPGIAPPHLAYDRSAYLRALQPISPTEPYLDALRAELNRSSPGRGFNEVPYRGTPLPPPPPAPGLLHLIQTVRFRAPSLPSVLQNYMGVTLADRQGGPLYIVLRLSLPETLLQSLTLSFTPATAADEAVVQAFGGLQNAPAAVVNLVPQIRLDGAVIATGKTALPTGTALDLTFTHSAPTTRPPSTCFSRNLVAVGDTLAVVFGVHQISEELVTSRVSKFLARLPSMTDAEAVRDMLDLAALRYLHRGMIDRDRLSDFLHMRFYQDYGAENSIAFSLADPQNLFDRPFVVTPGRLKIYAHSTAKPLDVTGPTPDETWMRVAWKLHNDTGSVLEHEIWEELVMIESVSTMKALQAGIRAGIPIRTINRSNLTSELSALQASASTRADIQNVAGEGATVTIPQRPVTIGAWTGEGYIVEWQNWSYRYTIVDVRQPQSPAPGGDTGGTPPGPRPPEQDPGVTGDPGQANNTPCSDPVNVANGNLFEQWVDYALGGTGPGILFQRTYNSLALAAGPLGYGWQHSYQMSLTDGGSSVTVRSESGGVLKYTLTGGVYLPPSGRNLTLTKDSSGYLLRRKDGSQFRFDPRGVLLSITDRNQNTTRLTYDGDRLRQVTDRSGRAITLSYDAGGRLTRLEDIAGRRVSYEYDSAGHLIAVVDLAGNRTVYAYYTDRIFNHRLKSVTTQEGRTTQFEYYGNGRVSRVTNPDGRVVSFLYLPLRNETDVIDPEGRLTTFQYNAMGNVVREIGPDGSFIESVYSADAKLEARTDAAGYTRRYTHDNAGNLTSVTDPLGRTARFTFEPVFNQVTTIQDARGNTTRYEYDTRGNLIRVIDPLGGETQLVWDAAGSLTSVRDAEGNASTFAYDSLGNPTEVRDALGSVTKSEFDRLSRLTRTVDPLGGEMRLEYDALDRVVRAVDPLARASTAGYDRDGRNTQWADFAGRITKFRYDSMDHLTQVADALDQLTQYDYAAPECGCPASANLMLFRDAAGFARSQSYDSKGQLIATTDALANKTQYSYDARSSLARKIDANGTTTVYEYDAAGQLRKKAFSDGTDVQFTYDPAGNLTAARNQNVTLTFTYDESNRVTSVTDSRFQKTIRYLYDRSGRQTALMDSEGGATTYSYDARGQRTTVTAPSGASVGFSYDALGRLKAINYLNQTAATLRYDAAGRLLEVAHTGGSAASYPRFSYAYDNAGNRTTITDAAGTHAYRYDELDRLTSAQHAAKAAEAYSYDAAGNRLSSATDPAYRYDAGARLISAEGATFTYDRNGNLAGRTTASGVTNYTWDAENQLVRVDLPDGGVVAYKYDPFGRRIEKNVNGTITAYLYDGNAILLELDAAGRMTARYTHGPTIDWPLVMERAGQTWFYHGDALGSVAALTDSSGNLRRTYAYDSWGRSQSAGDSQPPNPFLFAGRQYDAETGLYYMRARYYDPVVGRFMSQDPLDLPGLLVIGQSPQHEQALLPRAAAWALRGRNLGLIPGLPGAAQRAPQRLNAYAYAVNNPLLATDPSGLSTYHCTTYSIWSVNYPTQEELVQGYLNPDRYPSDSAMRDAYQKILDYQWDRMSVWQKIWTWFEQQTPEWQEKTWGSPWPSVTAIKG